MEIVLTVQTPWKSPQDYTSRTAALDDSVVPAWLPLGTGWSQLALPLSIYTFLGLGDIAWDFFF